MSRAYRISVSESRRQVICGSDHVSTHLEVLEVLPCDAMADLLASELEAAGFEREGDQLVRRTDDGLTVTVDPASGKVTVESNQQEEVELKRKVDGWSDRDFESQRAGEQRLRDEARQQLDAEAERETERLNQAATDRLEGHLADISGELNQAVNRATAEALKKKAAQLGRIKEVADDPETGALTIVVEV